MAPTTPCFVFDLVQFRERVSALAEECLKTGGRYIYPLKANDTPQVVACVRDLDIGLDTCSREEIDIARSAGFAAQDVTCCGTGFGREELSQLLEAGVRLDLDSMDELLQVAELAPGSEIGLRIALPPLGRHPWRAPYSEKFGIRLSELRTVEERVGTGDVVVRRLHVHPAPLDVNSMDELVGHLAPFTALSQHLESINTGGGWGDGSGAEWRGEARRHVAAARDLASRLGADQFVVEPGEFVAAPAGRLLTRIRAVKPPVEASSRHTLIVDAPYTLSVGSGMVDPYPIESWTAAEADPQGQPLQCDVYGRNNTPHDRIGVVRLVDPSPGKLLVVSGQGAYVRAGYGRFNARPTPATIVAEDGLAAFRASWTGVNTENQRGDR